MTDRLTHIDASGKATMVDVGAKPDTERFASAAGEIRMRRETLDLIVAGQVAKGDVFATARIAGVMAAKRTADLIPLCHPLALTQVTVDLAADTDLPGIRVTSTARLKGKTGVEMEALTACSVALLTVYDMAKAVDRGMEISAIRVTEKSGGKSGDWKAG